MRKASPALAARAVAAAAAHAAPPGGPIEDAYADFVALAQRDAGVDDAVDARTFGLFFLGDKTAQARGWPSRSGYHLGYVAAQKLVERHGLAELAHLRGPALRREIGAALDELAAGATAP